MFEKVYGVKLKLEREGSLDELYNRMHKAKTENPANVFGWLPL